MNKYDFGFQNKKGIIYPLIGVLMVPLLVFLLQDFSFGWMMVFIIVIVVTFIIIGVKKSIHKESIQMDELGFDSKIYGRIDFKNIKDVRITSSVWTTPLGLRLFLLDGKKIRWILGVPAEQLDTNKDAIAFKAFLQDLQVRLDNVFNLSTDKVERTINTDKDFQENTTLASSPKSYNPAEQLKTESQKINTSKKWTIPLSLGFALLAFARACGPDIVQKFRNEPDFSKIYQDIKGKQPYKQALAMRKADSIFQHFGKIYILTNDTGARLQAIPHLDDEFGDTYNPSSILFNTLTLDDQLDKYMEKGDSLGILVYLQSGSLLNSINFKNTILGREYDTDSTDWPSMTFVALDTMLHVIPIYERKEVRKDSSQYPTFYFQNVFKLEPGKKMSENIENAAPAMHMMFANTHFRSSFKLYFILSEKQGLSIEEARKNIQDIKRQIAINKLDTTQFVLREWN